MVREATSWQRSLLDSGEALGIAFKDRSEERTLIRDYLHEDKIPDWLGGLAQIPIPEGGLVPKSYYMSSQVRFPHREQEMARQCFQYSRSLRRIRARGLT